MVKGMWEPFTMLRRRNKILFTVIVAAAIVLFWKGMWGIFDIVFDEWIMGGHTFWSNVAAAIVGTAVLSAAGLVLKKLA